jgi:sodium/pantothenate symporter
MADHLPSPGIGALVALVAVIVVSVWLGTVAQKALQHGSFLKGYFLGNRGLGAWTLALTATVQSGGTFMGYPSLIYTHGWIVALWIGSYMVVPITGFAVLSKRFAQLSRRTGAITVPDLLRYRFGSPAVGLVASLFIIAFMSSMMVAQFKAGAIIMKISWPGAGALALAEDVQAGGIDRAYYIGLAVFSLTVVGYTLIGGFLASVWTDLFQSVLMIIGVVLLFVLVVPLVPGAPMQDATWKAVEHTGPGYAFGPGYSPDGRQFLPLGLAFSFFVLWVFGGVGSPAGMVRVMACRDTPTVRRSLVLLSFYNLLIYVPLLVICVQARAIMPHLASSDEVIPRLALWSTKDFWGGSLVGGLILAAPFGAVMATVSTYLVVIASGLVKDVYLRFVRPHATQIEVKRITYLVMISFGILAVLANIRPVAYLQAIVVFSSSSTAATLLVPALMAAFWRRATAAGAIAAMLAGSTACLALYAAGWIMAFRGYDQFIGQKTDFRPYFLWGLEPIVWGLLASLLAGVAVSLVTRPPKEDLLAWLFDADGKRPAHLPAQFD